MRVVFDDMNCWHGCHDPFVISVPIARSLEPYIPLTDLDLYDPELMRMYRIAKQQIEQLNPMIPNCSPDIKSLAREAPKVYQILTDTLGKELCYV